MNQVEGKFETHFQLLVEPFGDKDIGVASQTVTNRGYVTSLQRKLVKMSHAICLVHYLGIFNNYAVSLRQRAREKQRSLV